MAPAEEWLGEALASRVDAVKAAQGASGLWLTAGGGRRRQRGRRGEGDLLGPATTVEAKAEAKAETKAKTEAKAGVQAPPRERNLEKTENRATEEQAPGDAGEGAGAKAGAEVTSGVDVSKQPLGPLPTGWRFEARWVEVKGPTDALSERQRAWIVVLRAAGGDCRVCRVVDKSKEEGE